VKATLQPDLKIEMTDHRQEHDLANDSPQAESQIASGSLRVDIGVRVPKDIRRTNYRIWISFDI
jgi:hypothetical protein